MPVNSFPSRIARIIPPFLIPAAKGVYHALFRTTLLVEFAYLDWKQLTDESALKVPPAKLRYRVGEDTNLETFRKIGRDSANNLIKTLRSLGRNPATLESVLDFGCGCGRTLAWLMNDFPEVHWYGSDTDRDAIAWCSKMLHRGHFAVNNPVPPTAFPDQCFEVIYGISVFTHLDRNHQKLWLAEFDRLLKPGGLLLLSFYSEQVWGLTEDASAIREGRFVFRTSKKLEGICPDWYHTALQNEEQVKVLLSERFTEVQYLRNQFGLHDLAVAVKSNLTP